MNCRASVVLVGTLTLVLPACGGSNSSPTSPASTSPASNPPAASVTITITSAGVDKKQVEISVGGTVAFVNNDTQFHEMASDPHPVHSDCPAINQVGALGPGRSAATGALTTARTCGFHDHGQPTNVKLQGTIVIR